MNKLKKLLLPLNTCIFIYVPILHGSEVENDDVPFDANTQKIVNGYVDTNEDEVEYFTRADDGHIFMIPKDMVAQFEAVVEETE